jgi:DNA-binding IclR family transcriptional regulator
MTTDSRNLRIVHDADDSRAGVGLTDVGERYDRLNELGVTGKAFSILEAITGTGKPVSLADIIRITGITKPTAHRIVALLTDMGLVDRDPTGLGLVEGAKMIDLAHRTLASAAPRSFRRAILRGLSDEVGETCNYGVLSGAEVIYLDRVESKWPLGLRFEMGSRVPAHCTAIGKLLLSQIPEYELENLLKSAPLNRYTDNTLTDAAVLFENLQYIRRDEIGTDDQEFMNGVVCVAVPVAEDEICYGGLAVSAPEARMSLNQVLGFVPQMQRAARRLANTFKSPSAQPEDRS